MAPRRSSSPASRPWTRCPTPSGWNRTWSSNSIRADPAASSDPEPAGRDRSAAYRRGRTTPNLPAGFIPAGPESVASSRLQVYLPLRELSREQPGKWLLLRQPGRFSKKLRWAEVVAILLRVLRLGIRTVIFQKVHKGRAPELMALLKLIGRRVIYVESDEREQLDFVRHVDLLVAPSAQLADELAGRTGIRTAYIPDPLEYWAPETLGSPWQPKPRYRTLWIGSHKNWHQIAGLKASIADRGVTAFEIVTISDHPDADIPWSLQTVREELSRADLGIIPVTADSRSAMKSHNRATLFMALGIPVIVNDTPVYREVIADGETGFVYHSIDELAALPVRLANAELVDAVRTAAMARAEAFSLEKVVPRWRALVAND